MASSGGSFYQLPDELLLKIFSYLDIPDLVFNIQHVDSHWNAVVQDNNFWRDYVFTFDEQMSDKEIILLLKNMPALQALVASRGTTNQVIHTLCTTSKFITRLELHQHHKFTTFYLETIVKNLPQIQHLAFPLSRRESENAMKYSALIQQLQQLLSLRFMGSGFNTENCYFLKGIASACPLLHEIDLGGHEFPTQDIILFLEAKKEVISKFFAVHAGYEEFLYLLCACQQLQALHFTFTVVFTFFGETLSDMPLFDKTNLKHLGLTRYDEEHLSFIVRNLPRSTMSNLIKLDLSESDLDPVQFENILVNCVCLKMLILCRFFTRNSDYFQHIGNCKNLEYVDVDDTLITDSAVEIFAEKCRKLMYLDMSNCRQITDFSLQCLMKCSELRTLKLNSTQITGHNFHLIPLHLTKLRELHIDYCDQLDLEYMQQLQEKMPHLQVHASREVTLTVPDDVVELTETNIFTELY